MMAAYLADLEPTENSKNGAAQVAANVPADEKGPSLSRDLLAER
jgi:hypothetical protein